MSDETAHCGCGHPKAEHLRRMDDCTVEGCPCPLYYQTLAAPSQPDPVVTPAACPWITTGGS